MQKKLIALAVAGLVSTGAYAQTAVTVYGVADLSFDTVKTSGGAANAKTGSYTRVSSNNSYIGFKGSEDLGNGLKALFQFETDVNADEGSMIGNKRDTFVGLEGAFGTVKLGTLTTPTRALGVATDVNAGSTGIGKYSALVDSVGVLGDVTGVQGLAVDARHENTVLYTSPSFAGFSVAGAYTSGEDKGTDADKIAGTYSDTKAWDLGATYNNGPILAGVTYAQAKFKDAGDSKVKNIRVAGAYDFGVATVRAMWNQAKAESNALTGDLKVNSWILGGTFNVTPAGKIIAQYTKARDVKGGALAGLGITGQNTGAKHYTLGYEHSLSKRTLVKVIYSRIDNESGAAYDFAVNGLNDANDANVANRVIGGVDPSGLQFGLRHSF